MTRQLYMTRQLAADIVMEIIIETKQFQLKLNCLLNGMLLLDFDGE